MPLDIPTARKLVAIDPSDPLSRFTLGLKLFELDPTAQNLAEAAEHLRFANARNPGHLATYHVLAQVLIKLGHYDEARQILQSGIPRANAVGEGMGHDLAPAMQALLDGLPA
jgi:predicted Zn-dependent protease